MRLLCWNVQWCRGLDGAVDPARIAAYTQAVGAEVACFQEIASNFPDLPGSNGEDQPVALWKDLPEYEPVVGWAVDIPSRTGMRMRFGNMILSRLPVQRVLRHSLPWPASPDTPSMPRIALEARLHTPLGPLRVITTHLEYYSGAHRAAQVRRLTEILAEGKLERRTVDEPGPYRTHAGAASAILCGDFNLPASDPLHGALGEFGLVDAWQALHPGKPHPPTFRLHERKEEVAPYCCDFVFVTPDLVPRLRAMRIDADSRASDHQPVLVELG
ncbi:MAG TPA: endonuclease/exonuclease/phosphatase family protein [Burkholderiales bacterium]|nr:endonuclease/exonuclease/phosphatase family protein [Burkholderiales bacterium]